MRSQLAVLTAATALFATPALAAVPKTAPVLTASGGTQRGVVVQKTTGRPAGSGCLVESSLHLAEYPDAVGHDGTAVTWRIPDPRKPKVTVTLTRAGSGSTGIGPEEALTVALTPVRSGRKVVAWTARGTDVGYGDLHLEVTVRWPGNRCFDDEATYRFHLLSLPV